MKCQSIHPSLGAFIYGSNRNAPLQLRRLFKLVPKTELHLHIGGSTPKEVIQTFMKENGVPEAEIPGLMKLIKPHYENITDILDAYYKVPKHVYRPSQFKQATIEIIKDAADENVKILELRTSILNKGASPKEIVEAVEEGIKEGTDWVYKNHDYKINAYLGILAQRFGSPKDSMETANLAIELAKRSDSLIHSFDLAGDESKHSIDDHMEALKHVKQYGPERGIGLTIHAGETKSSGNISGIESIKKAIECGADRIAHALRLVDSDELKNYVIERKIPIEMAPWSHVQIKAVDSYPEHPIGRWMEEGMNINLNTDNRLMSQITLRKQLEQLWINHLIASWLKIKIITINGIKAAFIKEDEKERILNETEKEFNALENRFNQTIAKYLG